MNTERLVLKHDLTLAQLQADILIWSDVLSDLTKNIARIDPWSIEVLLDLCEDNPSLPVIDIFDSLLKQ